MTLTAPVTVPLPSTGRLPPLEGGDRLDQPTVHARYLQMPPGVKAELIGGMVYMASPVKDYHATPHGDLMYCLVHYRRFTPGVGTADNGTTILSKDSEPQPDAFMRIMIGGQTRRNDEGYIVGCPELVCEVADSFASYDLHVKRDDYERYGALEYLAAIVRDDRVARFVRQGNRLVEVPLDADGIHRSTAFPGFWLDAVALLHGDVGRLADVLDRGLATREHAAFVAVLASRRAAD